MILSFKVGFGGTDSVIGDAADCKFHCLIFFFLLNGWKKKKKKKHPKTKTKNTPHTKTLLENEFAVMFSGVRACWSSPPGVGVQHGSGAHARRPRTPNLHAPAVEDPSCLREQIPSEAIYSKRPSELKCKLYYLDLYLERVTCSELLLPVRSHGQCRIAVL